MNKNNQNSEISTNNYNQKLSTVYISYAHTEKEKIDEDEENIREDREDIVNKLERALKAKNINLLRDRSEIKYKDLISDFKKKIGAGKIIILIISDKYLKSLDCMDELLKIKSKYNYLQRIFPIILDNIKLSDDQVRSYYLDYWMKKKDNYESEIKIKGMGAEQAFKTKLKKCKLILKNLNILDTLEDIYSQDPEFHLEDNFETIISKIEKKINDSKKINENKKVYLKYMLGLVLLIGLSVIIFLKSNYFKGENINTSVTEKVPYLVRNRDSITNVLKALLEKKYKISNDNKLQSKYPLLDSQILISENIQLSKLSGGKIISMNNISFFSEPFKDSIGPDKISDNLFNVSFLDSIYKCNYWIIRGNDSINTELIGIYREGRIYIKSIDYVYVSNNKIPTELIESTGKTKKHKVEASDKPPDENVSTPPSADIKRD